MPYDFRRAWGSVNLRRDQFGGSRSSKNGSRLTRGVMSRMAILLFGALALALVIGACANTEEGGESDIQENLKVRNLEIVDDVGITRAVFTTISGGRPSLTLLDNTGDFRAWLTLNDDGSPNLVLIDQGRVVLMDGVGGVRSTYSADEANIPSMRHYSEAGALRLSAGLNEGGSPISALYDENGEVVWSAP